MPIERYKNINEAIIKEKFYPQLLSKDDCCGCGACYSKCFSEAKNAITMIKDELGFLYPQVDLKKCIGCQKCVKSCPLMTKGNDNE